MSLIRISSGMPLNPKDAVAVSEIRCRGKGLATYRESPSVPLSCTRCSVSSHWRSAEKIVFIRLLIRDLTRGGLLDYADRFPAWSMSQEFQWTVSERTRPPG